MLVFTPIDHLVRMSLRIERGDLFPRGRSALGRARGLQFPLPIDLITSITQVLNGSKNIAAAAA